MCNTAYSMLKTINALYLLVVLFTTSQAADGRPNIVIFLADDLGKCEFRCIIIIIIIIVIINNLLSSLSSSTAASSSLYFLCILHERYLTITAVMYSELCYIRSIRIQSAPPQEGAGVFNMPGMALPVHGPPFRPCSELLDSQTSYIIL